MFRLIIVFSMIVVSFCTSAQVEIILLKNPGEVYNGQVVQRDAFETTDTIKFKCVNISGSPITMTFRRLVLSSSTTFTDSFCDNSLCVDLTGPDWSTQNGFGTTIAAGDTSDMKGAFEFTSAGDLTIRYYVMDGSYTPIDSVDVQYTSFLKLEEEKIEFTAYPNPAKDVFNISVQTGESKLQVKLYSITGAEIRFVNLVEGVNKIDLSSMDKGVYFYSILRGGKAVETKKLIIN